MRSVHLLLATHTTLIATTMVPHSRHMVMTAVEKYRHGYQKLFNSRARYYFRDTAHAKAGAKTTNCETSFAT